MRLLHMWGGLGVRFGAAQHSAGSLQHSARALQSLRLTHRLQSRATPETTARAQPGVELQPPPAFGLVADLGVALAGRLLEVGHRPRRILLQPQLLCQIPQRRRRIPLRPRSPPTLPYRHFAPPSPSITSNTRAPYSHKHCHHFCFITLSLPPLPTPPSQKKTSAG